MVRGIGHIDEEAGKIHFAHQRPKGRHEDVADERRDDLAEGAADDHADRHVEDIAAHSTPPSSLAACPLSQAAKQSGFMLRQAQHERITPAYSMSAPFALRLSMDERRVFRSLLDWGLGMIDNSRDGHALYGLGPPVSGLSSVETECGMQGAHGQFEILFVNHAGDFDLRGADHHDIDALAREHFEHFRRDS
jgi:hypothetical protein